MISLNIRYVISKSNADPSASLTVVWFLNVPRLNETTEYRSNVSRSFANVCSPVSFYIYLENVDAAFKRAVEAGARIQMPVEDMFWGDRMGTVLDPFGYSWSLASHIKDLTLEEIQQGAQAMFAKMAKK